MHLGDVAGVTKGWREPASRIALVDGDSVTVKQYYREGAQIRLQPANPTVPVLVVSEERVQIQGVVIGVLRRF